MGWAIGFDQRWQRDVGYGVPAHCDHPGCITDIHRGLSYVCGGEPSGGTDGCGLHFCAAHLWFADNKPQRCSQCCKGAPPYVPKPDIPEWLEWKLTDHSWATWRDDNPAQVHNMTRQLTTQADAHHTPPGG